MYMVKGKLCPCCGFSVLTWLKPIQKMGAITSVKYVCVCMYVCLYVYKCRPLFKYTFIFIYLSAFANLYIVIRG